MAVNVSREPLIKTNGGEEQERRWEEEEKEEDEEEEKKEGIRRTLATLEIKKLLDAASFV